MENLTKALLIAGGVLIVIMVISLAIIAANEISTYYSTKHDEKMLEQTLDFNKTFENYSGQTIRGNELLSIINKIVDYNNYQANMQGYDRVIIKIEGLTGHQNEFLHAEEVEGRKLITGNIDNKDNDEEIKRLSNLSGELVSAASGIKGITETKLQRLAAEIYNIADEYTADYNDEEQKEFENYRLERLKKIMGRKVDKSEINAIKEATCKYYQLMTFKRAMFKCTEISYNSNNGRVNELTFEAVIENGKIKFE